MVSLLYYSITQGRLRAGREARLGAELAEEEAVLYWFGSIVSEQLDGIEMTRTLRLCEAYD